MLRGVKFVVKKSKDEVRAEFDWSHLSEAALRKGPMILSSVFRVQKCSLGLLSRYV